MHYTRLCCAIINTLDTYRYRVLKNITYKTGSTLENANGKILTIKLCNKLSTNFWVTISNKSASFENLHPQENGVAIINILPVICSSFSIFLCPFQWILAVSAANHLDVFPCTEAVATRRRSLKKEFLKISRNS